MAEDWDYENNWGASPATDDWQWQRGGADDFMNSDAWKAFTSWSDPTGPGSSGDPNADGGGGANWLQSVLSSLGPLKNVIGPLLQGGAAAASGVRGTQAGNQAAQIQSQALNRGIDLQTAAWLQQQKQMEPYLQAGQQGVSQLQQLAGRAQPTLPGATPGIRSADYNASLPDLMPGWRPQAYQGPDAPMATHYQWNPQQGPSAANYQYTPGAIPSAAANRWTPGQGPSAQDYRYTPGQTPDAGQYQSGPPQLYQGAMPGTQVSQLTGQQVLDQDPGAAFRQTEARKALEASALAKGMGMSGSTLGALQRQSQDLASQEYGNAWQRMMARDTEQYGRNWGQYQQNWNQGIQGAQLGLQTNAQNFGQAMSAAQLREQLQQTATQQGWTQAQTEAVFREQMAQQASQQGFGQQMNEAQLREQVNQVASQQGWTQAQAEAAFREQQNQMASQQGWNQALQGQQNQFGQGLQAQQWNQEQQKQFTDEIYKRMLAQNQLQYGRDVTQNTTDYDRQQNLFRQQMAQHLLPWEQQSTLANIGLNTVGARGTQSQNASNSIATLLAQQGSAQAMAPLTSSTAWNNASKGGVTAIQDLFRNLNT